MRNFFIKTASALTLLAAVCSCANDNSVELFNGKDLSNWTIYVDPSANIAPEDVIM